MKTASEKTQILNAITGTAELMGSPISPAGAAMMLEDFGDYPTRAVLDALTAVRREARGKLVLADVLAKLDGSACPERLAPNEAWALAVRARDDRETVVWTSEMSRAWNAVSELVRAGDMVAARMAFIEAYQRIVSDNRRQGIAPDVHISWGWDREGRAAGLQAGVASGILSPPRAHAEAAGMGVMLPGAPSIPDQTLPGPDRGEIVSPECLAELHATLAADLKRSRSDNLQSLQAEFDAEIAENERLRAAALASIADYDREIDA